MYQIENKDYGYKLTFSDFIKAAEMENWVAESEKVLENAPGDFGVFVDMRMLKPLPKDSQEQMQTGQKLYKKKGMVRSVVIVDNSITKLQFKRIAQQTGIYEWERYIDSSSEQDWERVGIEWIANGVDPDK